MFPEALVINPGRLRILTVLAQSRRAEFVPLRDRTRLTDGNLAAHAKRLQSAGLIEVDKQFRGSKPVTTYTLTRTGRQALEQHARDLQAAVTDIGRAEHVAPDQIADQPEERDDWVD